MVDFEKRAFFKRSLIGITAYSLLAGIPRPAKADPMTAIAAMNTAMQILNTFSSRENGLEAIMQAQSYKISLILDQLGRIEKSLTNIQNNLGNLPNIIKGLLRDQYRQELLAGLRASGVQFMEVLSAQNIDTSPLSKKQIQNDLESIRKRVWDLRTTLTSTRGGAGAEASMIVPLALALELGSTIHLSNSSVARQKVILNSYVEWIRQIRSNGSEGIWAELLDLKKKHDNKVDQMTKTRLGQSYGIKAAKTHSDHFVGLNTPVPCVLICDSVKEKDVVDIGLNNVSALRTFCSYSWDEWWELKSNFDPQLKSYQLEFNKTSEGIGRIGANVSCALRNVENPASLRNAGPDAVKSSASRRFPYLVAQREEFAARLKELNYYRARIAYCVAALQLANKTMGRIEDYKILLGVDE